MNLHRVELDVYDNNPVTVRAYEKLRFTREGVLREHRYVKGRYRDVYRYAILARKFWRRRDGECQQSHRPGGGAKLASNEARADAQ